MGRDIWDSLPLRGHPGVQACSEIWTLILNTRLSWGFLWWRVQCLHLRVHLPEAQHCKVVPFPSSELYWVLSISGEGNQNCLAYWADTFSFSSKRNASHQTQLMINGQQSRTFNSRIFLFLYLCRLPYTDQLCLHTAFINKPVQGTFILLANLLETDFLRQSQWTEAPRVFVKNIKPLSISFKDQLLYYTKYLIFYLSQEIGRF